MYFTVLLKMILSNNPTVKCRNSLENKEGGAYEFEHRVRDRSHQAYQWTNFRNSYGKRYRVLLGNNPVLDRLKNVLLLFQEMFTLS